jgi:hypothetical protein
MKLPTLILGSEPERYKCARKFMQSCKVIELIYFYSGSIFLIFE